MKRVLVPLDGSAYAETILPDAARLAGPDGVLILVRDAGSVNFDHAAHSSTDRASNEETDRYLEETAVRLRESAIAVETHRLNIFNVPLGIDLAAGLYKADFIACATHGDGPWSRVVHGRTAWRALSHSPVPVLLRHSIGLLHAPAGSENSPRRRILVPLDGSRFSEAALPLAERLAERWEASVVVAQVVEGVPGPNGAVLEPWVREVAEVQRHLCYLIGDLPHVSDFEVCVGEHVVPSLIQIVDRLAITDIVMSTHGRTGVQRVLLGSVADELVQRLDLPLILLPSFALEHSVPATEDVLATVS